MAAPKDIDRAAVKLLEDNGYRWNDYFFSFLKVRFAEPTDDYRRRPPVLITFEEVSDHGLTSSSATAEQRRGSLDWLRRRIKELSAPAQVSSPG